MEMGSFIELQLDKGKEYYSQRNNIARLNTGRAAIWHAFRVLGCKSIWLPYYQCESVREFLQRKGVVIKYYHIDETFTPIDLNAVEDEAVLLVNYFGIMSSLRMQSLASKYKNVILDNSQAFFCEPIENCMNVYSCRKFVGVPDGAYVIGNNAEKYVEEYPQCFSSDTALFMLQRIEYGCEGKAYQSRTINEERIDTEDCMKMSKLTRSILDGAKYDSIISKRKENFVFADTKFKTVNKLQPKYYFDDYTVPMVYPLLIEDERMIETLQAAKHFQGRWWNYIKKEQPEYSFEYYLSKYMIPITIDQRYGEKELLHIQAVINGHY